MTWRIVIASQPPDENGKVDPLVVLGVEDLTADDAYCAVRQITGYYFEQALKGARYVGMYAA